MNIEHLYETIAKIIEKQENVKIKYTLTYKEEAD